MINIFQDLQQWKKQNKKFALATVIKTWGSSPRIVGSVMAVSTEMEMIGSVSGGCVEGAVIEEALEVMRQDRPKQLDYGVSNEQAWEVGLTCGGAISLFVAPFDVDTTIWEALQVTVDQNQGGVLLSQMKREISAYCFIQSNGTSHGTDLPKGLQAEGLRAYRERRNQIITWEGRSFFAHVFPRKSQMLIIGAAHISAELVDLAAQFDFETIVIDPRGMFTQKMAFRQAPDQMQEEWPAEVLPELALDEYTYAVLLTHDPKIDDQALHILLESKVAYIGALGGQKTQEKRRNRLREAGFSEAQIARIHGPVGLDINAKRPQEIALSILAEVIQVKNQYL
ncbi:MAG: XdhC family protein [Bacteroidota bacterium]